MTMQATWTIEVAGTVRKYKNLDFERKLVKKTSTVFKAHVQYTTPSVEFFDKVEIKRNGTTEWKGFIENINIEWNEDGRWYAISGRDTSVIMWKKYGEEFQQYTDGIEGFFGKVNASELIKFILRTPRSDLPFESDEYKYNKMGWGIDSNRITDISAARTAYGDPKWTVLRKRGVAGWKNTGLPFNSTTKTVSSAISTTGWNTYGASPYLNTDDNNTSRIESSVFDAEAKFQLSDLVGATGLNSVHLTIKWNGAATSWWWQLAETWIYVSIDGGSTWFYVATVGGRNTGWKTDIFNVSNIFNKISYLTGGNAQVKFVNKSGNLPTNITYTYLTINYSTAGSQNITDYFQATFESEDIVGIYVESRADEESYPRNYEIVTVSDNIEDYQNFNEVDPNSHISLSGDYETITFDSYQNEDAYLYKDYGENQINSFDWTFGFKITSAVDHPVCFVPFVVSKSLNDLKDLWVDGTQYFTAFYVSRTSGVLTAIMVNQDGNGMSFSGSHIISSATEYYVRVIRSGTLLKILCYSDASLGSAYLLWTETITLSSSNLRYRYRMQACTYNSAAATHTLGEIYAISPEETILESVIGNTYRDIIHSWSSVNINNIKIKITNDDAHAWVITQLYIYKAEEVDYRIMHEDSSTPSFSLDQYIHDITIDDIYSTAIGPLNLNEKRIIDQINNVLDNLHSGYIPYEWYMELNTNNTFHICKTKGSDKSSSISFILGLNLESSERNKSVDDTFQRVKIKGNGEGARSEEASAGWINNTPAMSDVYTFFEEIKSRKEIVDKDIAELLSDIELTENAFPKDQIVCKVSKDDYFSMNYDVGDYVLITDSLISINSSQRVYNIQKTIDSNGEHITLYLGFPFEDAETTLHEIYERIKSIELGNGITGDWTDQAKQSKISVSKLSTIFEKEAKEETLSTGTNESDLKWNKINFGYGGQGTSFQLGDNGLALLGATAGPQIVSSVDYYWNLISNTEVPSSANEYLIVPKQNPKMEFEFSAFEVGAPSTLYWRNNDHLDIGLAKKTAGYINGHWFRFLSIGSSQINVYACWRDVGGSENTRFIMTISTNVKYRYIITYDYQRGWVTFEVWDIVNRAKYPIVAVRSGLDLSESNTIHPLFMQLTSMYQSGFRAQALIYHMKIQHEVVTEELGEE